jgi:hypothetical protein
MSDAPSTPSPLFDTLVETSGLSPLLGPTALRRALARAGITNVASMRRSDLGKALPHLRAALGVYLRPDRVDERMRAIEALL